MQDEGDVRKSLAIIVPLWLRTRVPGGASGRWNRTSRRHMQTDWDGRIRVPCGHVRQEVAISETMIPAFAEMLLFQRPGYLRSPRCCYFRDQDTCVRRGVAIREAKICSVLRTSGRRFLLSFVFRLSSFFAPFLYAFSQRSPKGHPKVAHRSTIGEP